MPQAKNLTPAQARIVKLLKKHRIPDTGRVKWSEIQKELPASWVSHIIRQQVQFALDTVGASTVDELIEKYDLATTQGDTFIHA